jgi:NADPH-dependent curcumin reductase CurA
MSDVNTFIDTIGKDISETVSPKIQTLAEQITAQTFSQYGPRVSTFASGLVKDVIEEQSAVIRDFVTGLIQDIFQRYRPELTGALHTSIVQGGLAVNGHDVRLELKRRDTGAAVSSLDIPVSLTIRVDPLGVTLKDATVSLDVVK